MGGCDHIQSKYYPILMFPVGEIRETWHFQTVILHKNLENGEFLLATRNTSCCEVRQYELCLVPSNWFDQQLIVLIHQSNMLMSPRDWAVSQSFHFQQQSHSSMFSVLKQLARRWHFYLSTRFECPSTVHVIILEYNSCWR